MSNDFENFTQEVESDIRQEKFEKIWKNHGKLIIGAFVAIVGLSAVYNVWRHKREERGDIISARFLSAQGLMFDKKYTDALAAMENIAASSHDTYAALAKFNVATILRQDSGHKNLMKAAEIYEGLMNDRSIDAMTRDLAAIFYVGLKLDTESDDEKISACSAVLDPIIARNGTYKLLALENKGLIQFRLKDHKAAADSFATIAQSEKAPDNVKLRARLMAWHIAGLLARADSKKVDR